MVILSPWASSRRKEGLPTMLDYQTHISKGSMFNTPNTFGIFVLDRVLAWVERNGGLEGAIGGTARSRSSVRHTRLQRLLEAACRLRLQVDDERDMEAG